MTHPNLNVPATIDALSDAELIDGLAPSGAVTVLPVDVWLQAEGYVPGTTRVSSTELHRRYEEWHRTQDDLKGEKPCNVVWFGRHMSRRFKKTRKSACVYYYIGRTTTPNP